MKQQFQIFRASHASTRQAVSGHVWSLIRTGAGERTMVVLPGGGGAADSMFPVVSALEQHSRVIAVGYPSTVTSADEIISGIRTILDDSGVEQACLLGHSLGGIAARAFAQAHPERVDSLIFANSAVYSAGRALLFRILLPILARLPQRVLAGSIRSAFNRLLKNHPDREFWLYYVNQCEMMEARSKGLRNQLLCLLDFVKKCAPRPPQANRWNGRVLILESDKETGFTRRERQYFRTLYPGATIHVFQGAGHLSFITHTQEFVGIALEFLTQGTGNHDPKTSRAAESNDPGHPRIH